MKKFFAKIFTLTLLLSLVACGGSDSSGDGKDGESKTFGPLLLELESNMGWSSVNEVWRERRDPWVDKCNNVSKWQDGAALLTELESVVLWTAVDERWANVRTAWINDCNEAGSYNALGEQLTIFESYVLWDVVSPNWLDRREGWINDCKKLKD